MGHRGGSQSKQGLSADAKSVDGGNGRSMVVQTKNWVPAQKAKETAGKTFQRGGMSASFFGVVVKVLPTCPRGDGGPRLGGKSRREEWLRHWAELTGCDGGGIDERPREEGFFASLPLLSPARPQSHGS
jgi:hypothetical protein